MKKINARQGFTRTNLKGISAYESFVPAPLPDVLPLDVDPAMARLLSTCSRKVGEVEGMSRFVPNADLYLTMYVRKEALLSAQIEGTQCTLDDVLSTGTNGIASRDVADVVNYVAASNYAVERMRDLPLSSRLLRETHRVLLSGVRGHDKEPGELRTSQNWVGPGNSTIATAPYVPPNPQDMSDALSALETFVNEESPVDPIARAALVHYQFETIHPFLDGNGRLGRLLITLCLMNDGVLTRPILYPSYYLKQRRAEYYGWLTRVRETGDYEGWVRFFCECLTQGAEDAIASLERLVELHERTKEQVYDSQLRSQGNALRLLEHLEAHPITDVSGVVEDLGVSRSTAGSLVNSFCNLGILRLADEDRQRYRSYVYEDYLAILREGGEPLP